MFARSSTSATASQSPLNTVLNTSALKLEFALLVFVCIDYMRKTLSTNFELLQASVSGSVQQGHGRPSTSGDVAGLSTASASLHEAPPPYSETYNESPGDLIDFDEPTSAGNHSSRESSNQQRFRSPTHAELPKRGYEEWDKVQSEQRVRESLATPRMQGLRRASLTFFDAWRMSVLRRVGSSLNVLGDTVRKEKARREAAGTYDSLTRSSVAGFDAVPTRLVSLSEDQRDLLVQSALLLLLGLENYPAHSRTLLLYVTASLQLPSTALTNHELSTAKVLLSSTTPADQTPAGSSSSAREQNRSSGLSWKMGLAAVGGAALIGVTGGLAAPLIAGGLGAVFGPVMGAVGLGGLASLLGGLIGNSVLVGALFGIYGAKRMSDVVERLARDVEDFELIPLKQTSATEVIELEPQRDTKQPESSQKQSIEIPAERLRVTICVNGSLRTRSDVTQPWAVLADTSTVFALRYEPTALMDLGEKLESLVTSSAFSAASYLVLRNTVFATLLAGLYWPMGLMKAATMIDNPFNVALARSEKAGIVLAQILMTKIQGERPVSLVGCGLGARVVWECCQELARQNAFGLVSDVVFMGLPGLAVSEDQRETRAQLEWRRLRSVVVGRVVNCYSNRDWVLRLLYRLRTGLGGVAGIQAVHMPGVENEDVSDLVDSYIGYASTTGSILQRIEFETDDDEVCAQSVKFMESRRRDEINEERRTGLVHNDEPLSRDGKVELVDESSGKIVLLDLESGKLDEKTQTTRQAELLQDIGHSRVDEGGVRGSSSNASAPAISAPPHESEVAAPARKEPIAVYEEHTGLDHLSEESDSDNDGVMSFVAPEALPDPEPVSFGERGRGVNMTWEG